MREVRADGDGGGGEEVILSVNVVSRVDCQSVRETRELEILIRR